MNFINHPSDLKYGVATNLYLYSDLGSYFVPWNSYGLAKEQIPLWDVSKKMVTKIKRWDARQHMEIEKWGYMGNNTTVQQAGV